MLWACLDYFMILVSIAGTGIVVCLDDSYAVVRLDVGFDGHYPLAQVRVAGH